MPFFGVDMPFWKGANAVKYFALVLMMLTGCATVETGGNRDQFVNAAASWKGGNIKDMIQVWGTPNYEFKEPKLEYGMPGQATWQDAEEVPQPIHKKPIYIKPSKTSYNCSGQVYGNNLNMDCDERTGSYKRAVERGLKMGQEFSRAAAQAAAQQRAHHCEVHVEFDAAGTITKVLIRSKNCDTRYRDRLATLTR